MGGVSAVSYNPYFTYSTHFTYLTLQKNLNALRGAVDNLGLLPNRLHVDDLVDFLH